MSRAIYGAPAEALRQALDALARLAFWISWAADHAEAPDEASGPGDRSHPRPLPR